MHIDGQDETFFCHVTHPYLITITLGVTHALVGCYETATMSYVDESRCGCEEKPLIQKVCNTHKCVST